MSCTAILKFDIRPVPSIPGAFVSEEGIAYRRDKNAASILNPRKPYLAKVGYYVVTFPGQFKRSIPRYIHRLVAEAFLSPPKAKQEVRHLDGTRTNNHATNLAWGTRLQNVDDMRRHGTMLTGAKSSKAKLSEKDVEVIRYLLDRGASCYAIAPVFDVSWNAIKYIKSGRTWGATNVADALVSE